jgi:hypothetical protein
MIDTHSSLLTTWDLYIVHPTRLHRFIFDCVWYKHSSLNDNIICTIFVVASFPCCDMRDTNSSTLGGTSLIKRHLWFAPCWQPPFTFHGVMHLQLHFFLTGQSSRLIVTWCWVVPRQYYWHIPCPCDIPRYLSPVLTNLRVHMESCHTISSTYHCYCAISLVAANWLLYTVSSPQQFLPWQFLQTSSHDSYPQLPSTLFIFA